MSDPGIPLRDFIAGLRQELQAAYDDGQAAPGNLKFNVGPVDVEFTLAATRESDGRAGVKFYVFELGGGASATSTSTQKVSLTLVPTNKDGTPFAVSDSIAGIPG